MEDSTFALCLLQSQVMGLDDQMTVHLFFFLKELLATKSAAIPLRKFLLKNP